MNLLVRVKLGYTPNFNFLGLLLHYYSGWVGGGWQAGGIETKTNSVQIQLNLPVGTELGNIRDIKGQLDVSFS